jgi:hypothetical protein
MVAGFGKLRLLAFSNLAAAKPSSSGWVRVHCDAGMHCILKRCHISYQRAAPMPTVLIATMRSNSSAAKM